MSMFDLLYANKNISITLTYPFDSLYRTQREEIDAFITIHSDTGLIISNEPMSINLRGKFRRMKCTMPPLLLNFKKSTLKALDLSKIDEIKLVTHCIEGPEGQENLAEEKIIYQLYESITPFSYRTIWVNVKYVNQSSSSDCIVSSGFLLEPDKAISARLDIREEKRFSISEDSIDFHSFGLASAFNFLIGNRDWNIAASRNAKLFYNPSKGKYMVIPYDFDYANIVGASYRRENLAKSMLHPFDRIYEGEYFKSRAGEILKVFSGHEKTIQDLLVSVHNPLPVERRQQISKYFENWFDLVKKTKPHNLPYGIVFKYKGEL